MARNSVLTTNYVNIVEGGIRLLNLADWMAVGRFSILIKPNTIPIIYRYLVKTLYK